jgi:hypothetical protein
VFQLVQILNETLSSRNDAKTVNAIAQGVFSRNTKLISSVLHFFIGGDDEEDSDDENEKPVTNSLSSLKPRHYRLFS